MPHIYSLQNKKLRAAYVDWISSQSYDFGVTINFNVGRMELFTGRRYLGAFFAKTERNSLGRYFHKKKSARISGVFAFENLNRNAHCHGVIKLNGVKREDFTSLIKEDEHILLSKIVPSAKIHISDRADIAAIRYMNKDQNFTDGTDALVLLSEFHRA